MNHGKTIELFFVNGTAELPRVTASVVVKKNDPRNGGAKWKIKMIRLPMT